MHSRYPTKNNPDGTPNPNWKPRNKPLFEAGYFVAVDGEGANTGNIVDDNGTKEHIYTLLAVKSIKGSSHIHNKGARLSSAQCLSFLTNAALDNPKGIFVSFSFMYDVVHILRDVPKKELERALSDDQTVFGKYGIYMIKYRARKFLHIIKLKSARQSTIEENGKKRFNKECSVIIWDVFGFFQSSFITALAQWGISVPEIIREGKAGRSVFNTWDIVSVIEYNNKELELLIEMMNKVREACIRLDIVLSRYDGAGALATAIFKKELPKDYIRNIVLPVKVDESAHYAYFGGRIETMMYGHYEGIVYKYDINSAYPHVIRMLPNLMNAKWQMNTNVARDTIIHNFSLLRIKWQFTRELPFYPFPWRDTDGSVTFPKQGYGYIWGVEYNRAKDVGALQHCEYTIEEEIYPTLVRGKPFRFVEEYYNKRQELKKRIKNGDDTVRGESLVIKLGLNSLYGKQAQKIGYSAETHKRPPFYNICYAGYITAYTRATLFSTAYEQRDSIISFATDGIFSIAPITVTECSNLGEWEFDAYESITHIQSGYYYLTKDGHTVEYCRGIDRSINEDERIRRREDIISHWRKNGIKDRTYPMTRMIGIKIALIRDELWDKRGYWYREDKEIETGGGRKRVTKDNPKKIKPHKGLVKTLSDALNSDGDTFSTMCRVPWKEDYYEIEGDLWGL